MSDLICVFIQVGGESWILPDGKLVKRICYMVGRCQRFPMQDIWEVRCNIEVHEPEHEASKNSFNEEAFSDDGSYPLDQESVNDVNYEKSHIPFNENVRNNDGNSYSEADGLDMHCDNCEITSNYETTKYKFQRIGDKHIEIHHDLSLNNHCHVQLANFRHDDTLLEQNIDKESIDIHFVHHGATKHLESQTISGIDCGNSQTFTEHASEVQEVHVEVNVNEVHDFHVPPHNEL